MGFIAMKGLSGGLLTRSDAAYAWLDQFDNVLPIWGIQRETELDEFIRYFEQPPALTGEIQQLDRKGPPGTDRQFLPCLRLLHALPDGNPDQLLCTDVPVDPAQPISRMVE